MKTGEVEIAGVSVGVIGYTLSHGRAIHFRSHKILKVINCNMWFPVAEKESWFQAVERLLISNGLPLSPERLKRISKSAVYTEWRLILTP